MTRKGSKESQCSVFEPLRMMNMELTQFLGYEEDLGFAYT